MLIALQNGSRVFPTTTGQRAECPECGTEVRSKCGSINVWHWAHVSLVDCDLWGEPESEWHLNWKSGLPPDWIEVPLSENGEKHRADIRLPNGVVIELQHSSISVEEISIRERFYNKMVWIFDVTDAANAVVRVNYSYNYDKSDFFSGESSEGILTPNIDDVNVYKTYRFHLYNRHGTESTYRTFRWRHAKKHIAYTTRPVFLDLGNNQILHLKEMCVEAPVRGYGYLHPREKLVNAITTGTLDFKRTRT